MFKMQTLRMLTFVLMVVGVLLVLTTGVHASPPQPTSGSFTVASIPVTSAQPAGNNCLTELDATFSFQGGLIGHFNAHFH